MLLSLKDITNANFGLLIAYIIPGFVMLSGLEPYSLTLQQWLGQSVVKSGTVAGFLFVTVASVGFGQLVSTLRWLVIDSIHERTGIPLPRITLRALSKSTGAFDRIVEYYYRYYQCHANLLVAIGIAGPFRWAANGLSLIHI